MPFSYFDAHCDTLTTGDVYHHLALEREAFSPRGQIFAVCAEGEMQSDLSFFERAVARLSALPTVLCRTAEELRQTVAQGRIAAVLSVEGAECVGCDPVLLHRAYASGVRLLGLTHNRFNGLAGTCREQSDLGLTDVGRVFAKEAIQLGLALDLSHLSDRSAEELLEMPEATVLASHSNARALCDQPRNLTDALFCRLVSRGGVCGVNLYTPFLRASGCAVLDDVYAHLSHWLDLTDAAAKMVCLGCDFDGCDELPTEVSVSADLSCLWEFLLRKNYPEQLVENLFFGNLYAFLQRVL